MTMCSVPLGLAPQFQRGLKPRECFGVSWALAERQHERLGRGNRVETDRTMLNMSVFDQFAMAASKDNAKKDKRHGFDPRT